MNTAKAPLHNNYMFNRIYRLWTNVNTIYVGFIIDTLKYRIKFFKLYSFIILVSLQV